MEGKRFEDIARRLIYIQLFITSFCGVNCDVADGVVYTDLHKTAEKGYKSVLKCQFYGTPIAVYWKKGDEPTKSPNLITWVEGESASGSCVNDGSCSMSDEFSLVIRNITVSDQGTYICRVSNYKGILIHNFTEVNVFASPMEPFPLIDECPGILPNHAEQTCSLSTSESITITCSASSYFPDIDLFFLHGSKKMDATNIKEDANMDGTKNKSISTVAEPSERPYACVASDIPGSQGQRIVTITVTLLESTVAMTTSTNQTTLSPSPGKGVAKVVGSSPCMPESDRFGRYTIRGGSSNTSSVGVPGRSRVQVSVRCDVGAIAQQSMTSQCLNGTWIPPWPRCEKPCSVPRNRGQVRQFVNGDATRPITRYDTHSTFLPDGTQLVARCRDPGKYRLIGDQRRTCQGGQWTGEEPECQPVQTQALFYGAWREVASNGTIVVYVQPRNPRHLDVVCRVISLSFRPPRLTTPLVNDGDLLQWHRSKSHGKRLDPISTQFSGMYTCNGSSSYHSVHVLFKAVECEVPAAPKHGRLLLDGSRQQEARYIFSSRATVSFECEDDYRLVGSRRITCETEGQWTDDPPVCIEKPCSVPRNRGEVRQFVNGNATRPITSYYTRPTLPGGTQLVARCRDPGRYRLIGDQRRTCQGGQWTGEEPECQPVKTILIFHGARREVATNGTVVVYVHPGYPRHVDVVCRDTSGMFRSTRLTTPLVNDEDLQHWHRRNSHRKRLDPISTDFSGMYTCSGSSSYHSVHVLFKVAECKVPAAPEHGRLLDGSSQQLRDIFPAGVTVSFECEDDYRLVGSRGITCEKGQWSDVPPKCKVSRCPELTKPDHAIMVGVYGYGRDIGDERIFHCRGGYVLRGDTNNLRCLESGVWSDPLPTCEVVVHHVSSCASVRCASWQRCEVTGPNSTVCGCINPKSCLTSGPTVCGTNGVYYSSECHLRAHACLQDLQLDIAENDNGCIYGIPDEDQPPIRPTVDNSPVDYSSFSSFEVREIPLGALSVPTEPRYEAYPPSQSAADSDYPDYYFFLSLHMGDPANDNTEDTTHSPPPPPTTRTQPFRNVNETYSPPPPSTTRTPPARNVTETYSPPPPITRTPPARNVHETYSPPPPTSRTPPARTVNETYSPPPSTTRTPPARTVNETYSPPPPTSRTPPARNVNETYSPPPPTTRTPQSRNVNETYSPPPPTTRTPPARNVNETYSPPPPITRTPPARNVDETYSPPPSTTRTPPARNVNETYSPPPHTTRTPPARNVNKKTYSPPPSTTRTPPARNVNETYSPPPHTTQTPPARNVNETYSPPPPTTQTPTARNVNETYSPPPATTRTPPARMLIKHIHHLLPQLGLHQLEMLIKHIHHLLP